MIRPLVTVSTPFSERKEFFKAKYEGEKFIIIYKFRRWAH